MEDLCGSPSPPSTVPPASQHHLPSVGVGPKCKTPTPSCLFPSLRPRLLLRDPRPPSRYYVHTPIRGGAATRDGDREKRPVGKGGGGARHRARAAESQSKSCLRFAAQNQAPSGGKPLHGEAKKRATEQSEERSLLLRCGKRRRESVSLRPAARSGWCGPPPPPPPSCYVAAAGSV